MNVGEVWIYDPAPGSLSALVLLVIKVEGTSVTTTTLDCIVLSSSDQTLNPGSTWTWHVPIPTTRGWTRVAP